MPVYKINNEIYNIPDDVVTDFEKDHPEASISYRDGEDEYVIPLKEKSGFLSQFPNAELAGQAIEASGETPRSNKELSQSTLSPYVKGKGEETEIFGVPYSTYMKMRPESQSYYYQQALDGRNKEVKEEEHEIDSVYVPKKVESESDVLENYRGRFAQTERGQALSSELGSMQKEFSEKYAKEYMSSERYRQLSTQYSGQKLNDEINKDFQKQYGERISKDLEPYFDAYNQQVFNRYGVGIQNELETLAKGRTKNQLADLRLDIDRELEKAHIGRYTGSRINTYPGMSQDSFDREQERYHRYSNLSAAKNLLDGANDIVNESSKKGRTTFMGGFGRGVRDKGFDVDTWTMGITDTVYGSLLKRAAQKSDRGEKLSSEEEKLLEAAAVNMATQAYFSSDLGRGYKAGSTSAQSVPFMLEFALNPVSASGSAIAKGILKFGAKRFGLKSLGNAAARNSLKVGSRLAGDAVAAAGMTATTGLGHVASGAQERMLGDVQFDFGEDGNIEYAGREDQISEGDAWLRSILSKTLENQSEMVFNAFRGTGSVIGLPNAGALFPGIERFSASKAGELYRAIKNNPTYRKIAEKTQFHGMAKEYFEEVYNNLANISLGESTWEDATGIDDNIDTFLGVAPTSIVMGMFGLGSVAGKSFLTRRNMKRFEKTLSMDELSFFNDLNQKIKDENIEDAREFVKMTLSDKKLTPDQKKEKIRYVYDMLQENTIEAVRNAETDEAIEMETAEIIENSDQGDGMLKEASRKVFNMDSGGWDLQPGHIVGSMGGLPLWQAVGSSERIPLKWEEIENSTIQQMPIQEVVDLNAEKMREEAQEKAELEAMYSPEIGVPAVGLNFLDAEGNNYQIVQKNPNGGWIAQVSSVDETGNPVAKMVEVSDKEYYDAMQAQVDAKEESINVQVNDGKVSDEQSQNEESTVNSDAIPVDESIQEEKPIIPVDEKGNVLYHKMSVEDTIDALNGEELDPEELDAFVSVNKDAAGKLLSHLQGKAPKMGTNLAKYKADKLAWREKVAEAQAQVDYWNSIEEEVVAMRAQPGDVTAEAIASMGEPMTGAELAATMLGTGRLPLLYDSYKKELGFGSGDARGMFGLFATKANGGKSIEEAGELLMLADVEGGTHFFDRSDPNAGRNAILDVLSGARTKGDLFGYIKNNRERMAERERQAELEAYEQTVAKLAEDCHLTPEEFMAFEESIGQMIEERLKDVSDEELKGIFAELYLDENDGRSRESDEVGTGVPEGEERAGSNEGGLGVLGEERDDGAGTGERGAERPDGNVETGEPGDSVLPEAVAVEGRAEGESLTAQENAYESLQSAEDSVSLSEDHQNVNDNEVSESIPQGEHGALLEGDSRIEEALAECRRRGAQDAGNAQAVSGTLSERQRKEIENRAMEEYATEKGMWISMQDVFSLGVPAPSGNENDVYLDSKDGSVYKVNNLMNSKSISALLERLKLHNQYFPQTKYELVGFSGFGFGDVFPVLKQDYIDNSTFATPEEIDSYMGALGFKQSGEAAYSNGDVAISDLRPRNVLKSASGSIYVIDADFKQEKQESSTFSAPSMMEGENVLDYAARVEESKRVYDAGKEVDTNPTDGQKEAGNYKKGHVKIDGFDITIENPKGSVRSGVDVDGKPWSITMNNPYGYIRGTKGVDGDHVDVFLGDSGAGVYVVDQVHPDGSFDEHKVLYGFGSLEEAKAAYLANYSLGWNGIGDITGVSKEVFKEWVDSSHRKTKPFAEYKIAKDKAERERDVRFREVDHSDGVNEGFNEELTNFTEENADKIHFDLGMPSAALLSAGVENKPIKLYGSKLLAKMKKHGFSISELRDLPNAVASPIAVFNNIDRKGNRSVFTELKTENGNLLVTIDLGKGKDANFDIVSSVFGKNDSSVVSWIDKGYATYIDKGKALNYLHLSAPIAEASNSSELSSITKIVESFENPTVEQGKIVSEVEDLADSLHTPVRIVRNLKELPENDSARKRIEKGSRVKGWLDTKSGEVVIYLPHAGSVEDARETVFHEVVGHYGLREMFGKDFDMFLDNVYTNVSKEIRTGIVARANKRGNILDLREATEEYLAELAERGFENERERTLWQRIKDAFVEMLRRAGVNLGFELTDNELRYVLWKSKQNLEGSSIMEKAADVDIQRRLRVGDFREDKAELHYAELMKEADRLKELTGRDVNLGRNEDEIAFMMSSDGVDSKTIDHVRGTFEQAKKEEKKFFGFFDSQTGKVYLCADQIKDKYDVAKYWMHENAHLATLRTLSDSELEGLYDNIGGKNIANLLDESYFESGLSKARIVDEYIAHIIQNLTSDEQSMFDIAHGNIGKVLDNWDILEDVAPYIENNLKYIFNGEKEIAKDNEGRVGGLDTISESGRENSSGEKGNEKRYRTEEARTGEEGEPDGTVAAYEDALSKQKFRAQEAYQDSMLALKTLQDIVLSRDGAKIKSFEDAYRAENRMSSVSTREMEVFAKDYFKPVVNEVARLINEDASYRDISGYLIAKHGLERNIVIAERDAAMAADKAVKEEIKSAAEEYKNGHLSEEEYNALIGEIQLKRDDVYEVERQKNVGKDYSGLTGLMESYVNDQEKDFTTFAEGFVQEFESKHDTKELWGTIHSATDKSLRKSYESGLMSLEQYESLKGRFQNYVPLRGWDETMADEVYEYLENKRSPVNSILKTAKGRKSLADDPIATIGNMAESTILQGNRNLMKQNFLNFVINHPSDLAQVRDVWYAKDNASGEFVPSFPNIGENATPEEVARLVEEHEERMKDLEQDGLAKRGRNGLDLQYKILPYQKSEHVVMMKRNGKEMAVYINGHPRAAQAINGLTNPDVEENPILSAISRFNRTLAANFTTRNPAFVMSNFSRDVIFATSAVSVKESPLYLARFSGNVPESMATVFRGIRGEGGTSEADRYFQEFLDNGGETGYANLANVDKYKKMIQKDLKRLTKGDYFKAVRQGVELFEDFNRIAEDISRFNTYMTSRQEGRSITESVDDAKEITVNFNRRGAGYKTGGFFGITAGILKNLFLFFNASVQSLANSNTLYKKNWKRFGGLLGGFAAAGFMMPLVNGLFMALGGDDDQDYYANLSEWTRRNNLCIYIPFSKGWFITIPLPIELRAFYGLGDLAYQETIGDGEKKGTEIAYDAINQIAELLPLNPLGNNGDLVSTIVPDSFKPIAQVLRNKDFTGKPIYKSNSFNEDMPEWTKTYRGTSGWLTDLSEWSNELGGGDKYKTASGILNWNPAVVEHLFQEYFGGMATTLNQLGKTMAAGVESIVEGEKSDDLMWRNVPVLNRFINDASDERSAFRGVNEKYYRMYDVYKEVEKNLKGYSKEVASGNLDYLDKLNDLYQSNDYKVYRVFKENKKRMDQILDLEKELPESMKGERKRLQTELGEMKRKVVDRVK